MSGARPPTGDELLEMARTLNARGEPYALVTVVRAIAPTSAWVGAQAIVLGDGTLHGWIGGGCARQVVVAAAREAIAGGEPKLLRIGSSGVVAEAGIEQHPMSCASQGTLEVFVQPYSPRTALCVLGDTPAADEARFLAERLRIRLTERPGDAPVVLVATQGQGDEEALEAALRSPAPHVLMIASRRKADALRRTMAARGLDAAALARLQAPAGPDAGARTPGEIALVAMVGVLALLRGRAQAPVQPPAPRTFVNPVCGMAVGIDGALHVETYEGEAYYFCCDGCWTTFRQDPARYAALHHAASR